MSHHKCPKEDPKGKVEKAENILNVKRLGDSKKERAMHGLYQRLISNMVKGVTEGFKKELEVVGVGYRAQMEGQNLSLLIGYSHPVTFKAKDEIDLATPSLTSITVSGIDKQKVGEIAAEIRKLRPPEPYKGKGIRYVGEYVRKKVGKSGVSSA